MTQTGTDESLTPEDDEDENTGSDFSRGKSSESSVSTSPSEIFWSQSISPVLERRMDKHVYKDGRHCIVENTLDGDSLQYVHCLSRRLESWRAKDLEIAWGMKSGTLNLDTRSNVFCVSAKFGALWEDYQWVLAPEDDILECYYSAASKGQEFPDIGEGPYKYRLIAHFEMKSLAIHRQTIFPNCGTGGLKPEHFTFSSFPFKTLGTLTSHVHPKFAISHIAARAGRLTTMLMFNFTRGEENLAQSPIIKCIKIVRLWNPLLDKAALHVKYKAFCRTTIDPNDFHSETSDRTANCRLRPHMSDDRLIKERGYVYVKGEDGVVRLVHKEDAPHLLTANKLRIFEAQIQPRRGAKRIWNNIHLWRLTVSGNPTEEGQIGDSCSDEN